MFWDIIRWFCPLGFLFGSWITGVFERALGQYWLNLGLLVPPLGTILLVMLQGNF